MGNKPVKKWSNYPTDLVSRHYESKRSTVIEIFEKEPGIAVDRLAKLVQENMREHVPAVAEGQIAEDMEGIFWALLNDTMRTINWTELAEYFLARRKVFTKDFSLGKVPKQDG